MIKRALLVFLFLCISVSALADAIEGKVVRVLDGDTIDVLVEEGVKPKRIRLAEIDCPEKKQAFGNKAKQFTNDMTALKEVVVAFDTIDRYGRIVGTVLLRDGTNVNEELVRNGLAWHYKRYSKSKVLAMLEEAAQHEGVGLWADKNPMPPWEFRKQKRKKK